VNSQTGFSDFVNRPVFKKLENVSKTVRFRRQVREEKPFLLGPVIRANPATGRSPKT
jgi:hypothetical protein